MGIGATCVLCGPGVGPWRKRIRAQPERLDPSVLAAPPPACMMWPVLQNTRSTLRIVLTLVELIRL